MSTGYSLILHTGIAFDYPTIDLENHVVTARVLIHEEVKLTVIFDLLNNTVQKEGSLEEVGSSSGISSDLLNEEDIIDNLRTAAVYFVENNITETGT